ncbi:hypothetical protein CY35_09G041800 [Sphagnum magellanicum]|nr:hypothetical protein CY35_09G041800 [Sphagnum magellanicum]
MKSIGALRAGSFKSALARGASRWWQKWEFEGAVYFTLEMKELKDGCEHFEISPPSHIICSNKSS